MTARFETDLVVAAGAGSGKTSMLVDLYVEVLERPEIVGITPDEIGPGRILCLTFTDKAAREIQQRIRRRITSPEWLRELESAPILTFHAWCTRLLRDYAIEAGLDPRFSVMTEEAADELLRRTAVDTLRRGLEEGDEPCRRVVETHGLMASAGYLTRLVYGLRTAGWPLRAATTRFEDRVAEVAAEAAGPLRRSVDELLLELAAELRPKARTAVARSRLAELEDAVDAWRGSPSLETGEALDQAVRATRGDKQQRDETLAALGAWLGARLEADRAHEIGVWPALAETVRREYRAARAARAALDFDDLLLRARELLAGHEHVRRAFRRRYRAMLIDEHQDTDPVQHEILELLVGAETLAGERRESDPRWCVVGDVQQAIYGFRGASVEAFAALVRGAEERGMIERLVVNYRSRAALVAFHNAFFPGVLTGGPDASRVTYVPQQAHRPPEEHHAVEILAPDEEHPAADGRAVEARALAARLRAALDPDDSDHVRVYDRELEEWRASRPSDVAILFRRLTQIEPYRRALQAVGLEPVVVGSGAFYARQEVFDVLNALEAALVPEDPIPLVGFLRSPMIGLPDDAIWRLARGWDRHGIPLSGHMHKTVSEAGLDEEETARFMEAWSIIEELRSRADRDPPGPIVTWLIDRTATMAVVDSLPDAGQRRANLARLIALADGAPAEGRPLLADWVATVRSRADRPPKDRDAALPEPGERIALMSIHQAKGLEFPIVALADIGGTTRGGLGGVAFDPHLGVVAKSWEVGGVAGEPTRSYLLAKESARLREEAEAARLLYVAATRARDHLILSAGSSGGRQGWWLKKTLEFAASEPAASLVTVSSLEAWAERSGSVPDSAETPSAGETYLTVLPSAPGELPARALAAAVAGDEAAPLPAVAREAARLRMARGEQAHRALELVPLARPSDFDLRGWLRAAGVEADDIDTVAEFVERVLWPRLETAAEVHRELPFRLRLPAPGGAVVGTIDCLWRDREGVWRVWDYKLATDTGRGERHTTQLAIYALAAAAALGLDEVRGSLWYLEGGAEEELPWDRAALADIRDRLARAFPGTADIEETGESE